MIKKITLVLVLTFSLNLISQEKIKGNGIVKTIKTDLKKFKKIIINNDFKVVLIKSNTAAIEIETDENIQDEIAFNVSDSTLVLTTDKKLKPKKKLNITIFCTEKLSDIELNDDSEMESLTTLKVSNMLLKINDHAKADLSMDTHDFKLINNNNSKIQLRSKTKLTIDSKYANLTLGESSDTDAVIRTDSLYINLKDKSSLNIEGNSDFLNTSLTDNSNFKGKNLNVKEASIMTKGSSELSIQVFDSITIEASEKSKIELYGNPKIDLVKFSDVSKLYKKQLSNK